MTEVGVSDAGVNRISMGVQSLDPEELAELGRSHTGERAIAAYEAIRRADCRNINVDLLYGLPGQTVDGWRDTLARVLDLGPDHLSAYALTPEPGTEIGTAVASGRLMLPVDDVIERQETVLYQAVAQAGMRRYEISNYARPGSTSRHNRFIGAATTGSDSGERPLSPGRMAMVEPFRPRRLHSWCWSTRERCGYGNATA
jgi:oxygen-independent coproporphyrinogen-3 oxidase